MDIVKIGIIGIGNMGTNHARLIAENKIEHLQLTAVADLRESSVPGREKICRNL